MFAEPLRYFAAALHMLLHRNCLAHDHLRIANFGPWQIEALFVQHGKLRHGAVFMFSIFTSQLACFNFKSKLDFFNLDRLF